MAGRGISDEPDLFLTTLAPTSGQRRSTVAVVVALLILFGIAAPFAAVQLPQSPAFVTFQQGILCVSDLITAALLFSQFSFIRSRTLLVLASGYLFTALIVIPHTLTFPGAFAPTGLLGAGRQSTAWLYIFWHLGFPLSLLAYAWLKDERFKKYVTQVSTLSAICRSAAIVIVLVFALTLLATVAEEFLPRVLDDDGHLTSLAHYIGSLTFLICALALVLLWIRRRSVLDLWLMVVACALLAEVIQATLLVPARYALGYYVGRTFSFVTSVVVLIVLLAQTTRLYERLARSNIALQRERDNKLMNLEAMVASISHEVRQPLATIANNGGAALRFLGRASPDVEEARSALNCIVTDSHRAAEVFDSLLALFGSADKKQEPVDVNEIVLTALRALRGELEENGITTLTELTSELPLVPGHRGQLEEVILNLARNAIEAMDAIKDGSRVLRLRTWHDDRNAITVAIQDTGPGIDDERLEFIFDPFVTTKPKGMGLGLAICRMIVERHGGKLTASSDNKSGALFQLTLPIKPSASFVSAPA
jgi:signal transduction histidine kinase